MVVMAKYSLPLLQIQLCPSPTPLRKGTPVFLSCIHVLLLFDRGYSFPESRCFTFFFLIFCCVCGPCKLISTCYRMIDLVFHNPLLHLSVRKITKEFSIINYSLVWLSSFPERKKERRKGQFLSFDIPVRCTGRFCSAILPCHVLSDMSTSVF